MELELRQVHDQRIAAKKEREANAASAEGEGEGDEKKEEADDEEGVDSLFKQLIGTIPDQEDRDYFEAFVELMNERREKEK